MKTAQNEYQDQINFIQEIHEEINENIPDIQLEEIGILKKLVYYGFVSIGYLTIINEISYAKFNYDANVDALNSTAILFLKQHHSSFSHLIPFIALPIILLNGIGDILMIRPIDAARQIVKIEKIEGKFFSKRTFYKSGDHNINALKKMSHLIFFKVIPTTAMVLNFTNGAFSNFLSVNDLNLPPVFKNILTSIFFMGGLGFFIFLSYEDVLRNFEKIKNFSSSPVGILFRFSKSQFLMPLSRFFVALAYDCAYFNYITVKVITDIFNLVQYKSFFSILSISSSTIVTIGTRLMPNMEAYIKPIEIGENQYNLNLLDNETVFLSKKDQCLIAIKCSPLSLIRGFGLGMTLYHTIQDINNAEVSNTSFKFISVSSSLVMGIASFFYSFYSDFNLEVNIQKRKQLELSLEPSVPIEDNAGYGINGSSFLSTIINLGCQISSGFLGVAGIMLMLESVLGKEAACFFGIYVAIERGWINFNYYHSKISERLSNVWSHGFNFSNAFNFFKKNESSGLFPTHEKNHPSLQ